MRRQSEARTTVVTTASTPHCAPAALCECSDHCSLAVVTAGDGIDRATAQQSRSCTNTAHDMLAPIADETAKGGEETDAAIVTRDCAEAVGSPQCAMMLCVSSVRSLTPLTIRNCCHNPRALAPRKPILAHSEPLSALPSDRVCWAAEQLALSLACIP